MTTQNTETVGVGNQARTLNPVAHLVRGYQWLASQKMMACAAVVALTLGLRAAVLPWLPVPQPSVHDEFSYLLAADTYAHGRLVNPIHPFWQHFETYHVLQQPTYASKYQPLQGLILAVGQKFFGEPWIGVYLSTVLMCATICWMLQGWISPDWALLGALLCALRVGVLSYWMNSYLGGAVPGIGGALALGALVRIWRREQFGHSITWALGLTIVAFSRPYDAAVLGCASAAVLLWCLRKSRTPFRTLCVRVGLPASVVLAMCAASIAYNNYRVTGHVLTLPYQAYDRQYAVASLFTTIPLRPEPAYHHAVMRKFWAVWNVGQRTYARTHPVALILVKLYLFDTFFFPFWALMIPVLLCPYDLITSEERITVFLLLVFVLMITPLIAAQPHYAAAFAGVIYLRFLHSLTRLWRWQPWGKPVGRALGLALVGLLMGQCCNGLFGLVRYGEHGLTSRSGRDWYSEFIAQRSTQFEADRRSVMQALEKQPGRQLVLVRYAPEHDPQDEWVYNRADIDAARIVWAREMGPEEDRTFLKYFSDRRVWLLEPDSAPLALSPYPHEGMRSHD